MLYNFKFLQRLNIVDNGNILYIHFSLFVKCYIFNMENKRKILQLLPIYHNHSFTRNITRLGIPIDTVGTEFDLFQSAIYIDQP